MSGENEKMKSELDEMFDYFSESREPEGEEVVTEPEPTSEPVSEPVEDEEVVDDQEVISQDDDSEPEPEPEDPLEAIRRENAELKARLEAIEKPKPTPAPEPEPEPLTIEDQNFLDGVDFEEATTDPETFNKLLNTLYKKAVSDTQNKLGESVLRSIPDIVRTNINTITNLKAASDKFYDDNKDLAPFKKVVATVFEEVAAENPDKELSEILSDVAAESRKRLDLHKKAAASSTKPNSPKLPRKSGQPARGGPPSTTGIESELAEMNKVLGF